MKLDLRRYSWLILAPAVASAAFLGGRELRPDAIATFDYDLEAPGYEAALPAAGLTNAGFSGFGAEGILDGETLVGGRVTSVRADSLTIETESGQSIPIRITGAGPLRRIEAASLTALRPGMTVVARTGPNSDEAEALLIVATP